MNLIKNMLITRGANGSGSGQGILRTGIFNMAGWDGIVAVAAMGNNTNSTALSFFARQNTSNSTTGMATLDASMSVTDSGSDTDNDLFVIDIYKPQEQFLDFGMAAESQAAVWDGIVVIQYLGDKCPITQSTSVNTYGLFVSPDEA